MIYEDQRKRLQTCEDHRPGRKQLQGLYIYLVITSSRNRMTSSRQDEDRDTQDVVNQPGTDRLIQLKYLGVPGTTKNYLGIP